MSWIIIITALKGQRHFWRNWAIATAIYTIIVITLISYSLSSGRNAVKYADQSSLILGVMILSCLQSLAIFGAVRGFLCMIKLSYWKKTANAK
jgi:hypothetical protein